MLNGKKPLFDPYLPLVDNFSLFFFVCVFLSALRSYPFLELWKGNAVTTPEEYHSSDSVGLGKGSPELPTSPFGDSREVCGLTFRCHSL